MAGRKISAGVEDALPLTIPLYFFGSGAVNLASRSFRASQRDTS